MNNRLLRIAATLASLAAIRTLPQSIAVSVAESAMTASVAASVSGECFHDPKNAVIRGFYRFMDDGRTVVILIGSYLQFGSHEARVSAPPLSLADDKIPLELGMMQALNAQSQR